MNIEELFENEKWAGYGMVVTDDANQAIDYLKTEVMEYVAGLEKRIAELELRLGCCRDASAGKDLLIAELEARNKELMCAMRECACEPSRIVENGIGGMTLEAQAARSLIDKARDMYEKHNGGEA